jgi:hypothetical protein
MPSDEGVGLDNGQSLSPRKETRKQHQGEPGSITGSARIDLTFPVQTQLFAEEEVLSGHSAMGRKQSPMNLKASSNRLKVVSSRLDRESSFGINDRIAQL